MKKTLLTLFTTIAVCGMSYSQVYAQIDVSVFENKADYDVDMDDFDDTGEISFVGGDNMPSGTVIGNPDGDSGYISGELDIKIIDDGNIAAHGTHEELLASCPLYEEMWNAHISAKDTVKEDN